MLLNRVI